MSVASDLLSKVMGLPESQRAELAHHPLLSLEDEPADPDAQACWDEELEKRAAALDRGEAESTPWREALDRMRGKLESRGSE
jgi:hypothetical protein